MPPHTCPGLHQQKQWQGFYLPAPVRASCNRERSALWYAGRLPWSQWRRSMAHQDGQQGRRLLSGQCQIQRWQLLEEHLQDICIAQSRERKQSFSTEFIKFTFQTCRHMCHLEICNCTSTLHLHWTNKNNVFLYGLLLHFGCKRWRTSLLHQFAHFPSGHRGHLTRFGNHRVACSYCRCNLPCQQIQRKVPGADQASYTQTQCKYVKTPI